MDTTYLHIGMILSTLGLSPHGFALKLYPKGLIPIEIFVHPYIPMILSTSNQCGTLIVYPTILKHQQKYKYLHLGLVQAAVKPLTREGLNTSVLFCLRDKRQLRYKDSLLGTIETSLSNGPVYFDCYPNFTVSLSDQNILDTLTLDVKIHNYTMKLESLPLAVIYRVHYKDIVSAFNTKALRTSSKGETVLLQIDLSKANYHVPKTSNWEDIFLLEKWQPQEAVPPNLAKTQ